jgi:ATP-dependent Clp protease protease subunit
MEILIAEPITEATVNRILAELIMKKEDDLIVAYINSPGGDVEVAYAIYELFKLSGKQIVTYAVNNIFSCAVVIYLAGDERYASNYSNFMIHEPYHEYSEEAGLGSREYKKQLKSIRKTTDDYFKLISRHTTLSPQKIKKYIQTSEEGDWYFKTPLAKKLGLVTKVGLPIAAP